MNSNRPSGLLWFDNSDKPWQDKVLEAAKAHERRLWLKTTHCHVHSGLISEREYVEYGEGWIECTPNEGVLKDHFFAYHLSRPEPAAQRDLGTSQLSFL